MKTNCMSSRRIISKNLPDEIPNKYQVNTKNKNNYEVIKVKDIAKIHVRIGWKNLKQDQYTKNGPYLVAGHHIVNGMIQWDLCDHISDKDYLDSPEIALKNNDIIFSKDGTLGNPCIIKNLEHESTINATMMLIRVNDKVHPEYFLQILKSSLFDKFISKKATKSGVNHILVHDFMEFEFPLPSRNMQIVSANLLSYIDKKCDFIETNYKLSQQFKEYLLRELIPTPSSKYPSKRFHKYDNIWKFIPLKNIGKIITGATPKGKKEDVFDDDGLMWATSNDINDNKYIVDTKRRLNREVVKESKIIPKRSVLVTCIGIIGKLAINNVECSCNQQINAIIPYDDFDCEFVYYNLMRYNKLLEKNASQSVTLILNKSEFSSIKLPFTGIEEQKDISKFISLIDYKLELLNKKLELTKKYKEAVFNQLIKTSETYPV